MDNSHGRELSPPGKDAELPARRPRQPYRSFKYVTRSSICLDLMLNPSLNRKKFAKMKVRFVRCMEESERLMKEELQIQDTARRIREQNE